VNATEQAPWVLLRGLGREAGHWGDFADRLQAAFPGSPVLTPDLPGCGSEQSQRPPTTVAGLTACVRAAVRRVQPEGPLRLVGMSLGGMMALDWLQQHPEEISQVVLINTSVGGISPPWRRLRLGGAWGLVRAALASDVSARERHVFGFTSARLERKDEVVARWTELARARPVHRATAARHLLAASRFRLGRKNGALLLKEAIAAGRPVLVLVSERDGMVASACSLALAAQLGTPVRVHATAGHDLPLDDPEWVIAQIAQWQQTPLATGPGDS
jgi:pimeloyl-ACP methyl ester carboxylesterase